MEHAVDIWGEKIRVFFGLSRMSHSILDIAHPAAGALLALGAFPAAPTAMIGFLAAFAGFTSVFALNDLMDWRVDKEKADRLRNGFAAFDLDALGYRHPIAQGKLIYQTAFLWVLFWGLLALGLAYLLNPVCALILIAAVGLETGYCSLLRVTHWKALLSGSMVGIGALAGIYAVDSHPPPALVMAFFVWTYAWEVGGRNIPNDWTDLEEDASLGIRTIPIRYGRKRSSRIAFALILVTVGSSFLFPFLAPIKHGTVYLAGAAVSGAVLLVIPAIRWLKEQSRESALILFNRTCFYPVAVFIVILLATLG